MSIDWAPTDRYRWLTWLVAGGLLASAGAALFGMPPIDLNGRLHSLGVMDPLVA